MVTVQEKVSEMRSSGKISQEEFDLFEKKASTETKTTPISSIKIGMVKESAGSAVGSFFKEWGPTIGIGVLGASGLAAVGQDIIAGIQMSAQQKNAYAEMFKKVPQLKEYPKDEVDDYYEVVKQFAPKMATNPLVAGNLVNKMVQYGGVDSALISELSKATKDIMQATTPGEGAGAIFHKGLAGMASIPSSLSGKG